MCMCSSMENKICKVVSESALVLLIVLFAINTTDADVSSWPVDGNVTVIGNRWRLTVTCSAVLNCDEIQKELDSCEKTLNVTVLTGCVFHVKIKESGASKWQPWGDYGLIVNLLLRDQVSCATVSGSMIDQQYSIIEYKETIGTFELGKVVVDVTSAAHPNSCVVFTSDTPNLSWCELGVIVSRNGTLEQCASSRRNVSTEKKLHIVAATAGALLLVILLVAFSAIVLYIRAKKKLSAYLEQTGNGQHPSAPYIQLQNM